MSAPSSAGISASSWGGRAQQIHGGTLLTLAADGRIAAHRDYWDAAEGVYEKLPFVGALLRVIKRRMA